LIVFIITFVNVIEEYEYNGALTQDNSYAVQLFREIQVTGSDRLRQIK